MRFLTKKERAYLEKLAQRNYGIVKEGNPTKEFLFYEGLQNPMAPGERQVRRRIRNKAIAAMFDLTLISGAGVLPDRKIRKEGTRSVIGMLSDIDTYVIMQKICKKEQPNQVIGEAEEALNG